jgi:hypothetical protein
MIKLSVDTKVLEENKAKVDILLANPPIVSWKNGIEMGRYFTYLIGDKAKLVYRPESPLPSGATVYIEIDLE